MAAHDGWWIMRVADSLGQSAPGTAASILNPALGLSLLYAQTFESSRAEYLSLAAERGLDTSEEAAERYGHNQALIQTPFEIVGTVAIGRTMKSIFKSIPRKALTSGPETYGKWLSSQIGKSVESTAGEVFITTPGQVIGESLLAEDTGVRGQTTWNEKGTATLDAMSIALGQSSFMTGSSIVTAGMVKTAKGDFGNLNQSQVSIVTTPKRIGDSTEESVKIKLQNYLLDPEHLVGREKARWFERALGFTRNNMNDLAKQFVFKEADAIEIGATEHGVKFNQILNIAGANGRTISVMTAWIRNNDGIVRLITAFPNR